MQIVKTEVKDTANLLCFDITVRISIREAMQVGGEKIKADAGEAVLEALQALKSR
jgi:hypothetical protein